MSILYGFLPVYLRAVSLQTVELKSTVTILIVAAYSENVQINIAEFPLKYHFEVRDWKENAKLYRLYYVCTLNIKTNIYVNALDSYCK